jgi:hypothetical protein
MRYGRRVGVLLCAACLPLGCVTPMVDYKSMSPEQIHELVKDRSMAANCLTVNSPYGRGINTYMAIDAKVLQAGGSISINDQCQVIFQNGGAVPFGGAGLR